MSERHPLVERDRKVAWHPYTQHGADPEPMPVASARGARLTLADGREILDAVSSWWSILHGHAQPELIAAMETQARTLDHVMFGGSTHEPAVALAEELLAVAPADLTKVFWSDNGSTAVEIALKMAYHTHLHAGEGRRTVFVALEGAYHGDTFGAMAVGDPVPFFEPYAPFLFEVVHVPPTAEAVRAALAEHADRLCAFVAEPLVQGAAGMVMHDEEVLRAGREGCDAAGAFFIADEVMTGFGRTGSLFACDQAGVAPDLLCLAKGLTGGLLPLAVTLATERIYGSFYSEDRTRFFPHGHTWTAHAIGCAVARASLRLTLDNDVPARMRSIGERIEANLSELRDDPRVRELRRRGGVVALELHPQRAGGEGYMADLVPGLRRRAIEEGVLLRPLGNVLYALPPACTSEAECDEIARVMTVLVREL